MAEGEKDAADNSDDEKDDKAIQFAWDVENVDEALNHIRMHHHHQLNHFL